MRPRTRTYLLHSVGNVCRFEYHLHQCHVLFIHLRSHQGFYRLFHDVVHRQPQCHTRQGASPRGVTFGDCHGIQATAFRIRRAQEHHQLVWLVTFRDAFDFFLTFQVKGAGSRSNEAIGRLQDHFGASTPGALSDGAALHAIALS